ncbi:MAG: hypothetical protein RLZZ182_2273 [Pseudomonadota bacterium]
MTFGQLADSIDARPLLSETSFMDGMFIGILPNERTAIVAALRAAPPEAVPSAESIRLARGCIARREADARERESEPTDYFDYVVAKEFLRCCGPNDGGTPSATVSKGAAVSGKPE